MKTSQASNLTADDYISIQGIAEHRWPQAMLERDWDAALAMCTPDVVYMPVDQPRLEGQAALRKWLNEFPALVEFSQPLESVDGMNHLAVALGRFTVKLEGSGQHINGTGKVMCCLEKASSGQWLVKAVCWNWDQPMPPAI